VPYTSAKSFDAGTRNEAQENALVRYGRVGRSLGTIDDKKAALNNE
jgi:hypothetical protein